jgi:hypothetical protein
MDDIRCARLARGDNSFNKYGWGGRKEGGRIGMSKRERARGGSIPLTSTTFVQKAKRTPPLGEEGEGEGEEGLAAPIKTFQILFRS